MNFKPILIASALSLIALCSCDRDEEIVGCTDYLAENHDPRATVDDGSCTYSAESQTIWKDGAPGGWNGNLTTYGFVPTVCTGNFMVSGDTSSTSDGVLVTDENGDLNVQFVLTNPRTARNYIEGFVRFEISKPDGSSISTFKVYVHGKEVENSGNCGEFIRSQELELSAAALTSSSTSVAVPFRDFNQLLLADVGVAFGIAVEGATPDTEVLRINNIRWTRF